MIKTVGYAAKHSFSSLKAMEFERDEPKANEVQIEVLFCGVCHSDIHQVKNEWGNTVYPCMPGHEIVGRVVRAGDAVTRHAAGDLVGVGCMIDSCRRCPACTAGEENYCEGPNSWLATYNGPMVPAKKSPDGENHYGRDNTYGGYSNSLVVPEDFALKVPAAMKPEVAAPLLCAGVTTYSPLKHWGAGPGKRVGVIGFGGLGDIAIKLAKAMGAEVVVFTHTEEKIADAKRLGVEAVLESELEEKDVLLKYKGKFDLFLSTIPKATDLNPFLPLLKRDGHMVIVGALDELKFNNMVKASHRLSVAGSLIGNLAETQEVLDFCAEHGIAHDLEIITMDEINDAHKKVNDEEVRFRYVIDMKTLDTASA